MRVLVLSQWVAITAAAMDAWEARSAQSRNAFENPPDCSFAGMTMASPGRTRIDVKLSPKCLKTEVWPITEPSARTSSTCRKSAVALPPPDAQT